MQWARRRDRREDLTEVEIQRPEPSYDRHILGDAREIQRLVLGVGVVLGEIAGDLRAARELPRLRVPLLALLPPMQTAARAEQRCDPPA